MSEHLPAVIEATPEKQKSSGAFVAWLSILLNLLLVGGIAFALFWAWPHWSGLQQGQQQLRAQQTLRAESLEQQHQDLEREFAALKQQLEETKQRVAQQQQQLVQVQHENQKTLSSSTAWQLWQTQQLVQLAGQKIWLEHNVPAALRVLRGAGVQLKQNSDSSFLPLRHAIAADIEQLEQLKLPDLPHVQLELSQLRQLALSLPIRFSERPEVAKVDAVHASDWQGKLWQNFGQFWSSLVRVRATTPEDLTILSAEQQLSLRNTLAQQLLLAELSALNHENQMYQSALQQAMDSVQRYFLASSTEVQQLGSRLAALSLVPVEVVMPTRLQSTEVLNDLQLEESNL